MVYASIYLYLPQFLSSVLYNFPSTGLLIPLLNLFLGALFLFGTIINGIAFLVSLSNSDTSLLVYKNTTDFLDIYFVFCYFTEFIYQS